MAGELLLPHAFHIYLRYLAGEPFCPTELRVFADETGNELPTAFIVQSDDSRLAPQDVVSFAASRLAPYKKIREIELIDAIPKNPSGKILRRQLIEAERAKQAQPAS